MSEISKQYGPRTRTYLGSVSLSAPRKRAASRLLTRRNLLLAIGGLLLAAVLIFGWQLWRRLDGVFVGGVTGLFRNDPLDQDTHGRTNILAIGTDEGGLTDSIMVISLNQSTGQGVSLSLPRDLWVERTCWGRRSSGKLNETYTCAARSGTPEDGARALMDTAGHILDIEIHYFIKVDDEVLIGAVDAVGGITIELDRAVYDVATNINFSAGTHHINGYTALAFARSRGAYGGFGVANDFSRGLNQQLVLRSLQSAVLEDRRFLNPATSLNLLESFGDHVTTSFQTSQIRTLIEVGQRTEIRPLPLAPTDDGVMLVRDETIEGLSALVPAGVTGRFDYSLFHEYFAAQTITPPDQPED
ncbi:LCP family protein [Candidatus Saccharibacteria bacterium]|nr:LCP family protein [Candidatus Saccharibacteria bacterium]